MKTIWKFDAKLEDEFVLSMPKGAQVLTVQLERREVMKPSPPPFVMKHDAVAPTDVPVLWAVVDPDAPREDRKFRLAGTGTPLPDLPIVTQLLFEPHGEVLVYIGTFRPIFTMCGHLFEHVAGSPP